MSDSSYPHRLAPNSRNAYLWFAVALGAAVGVSSEWQYGLFSGLPVLAGGVAAWWPREASRGRRALRFAVGSLLSLGAEGALLFVGLVALVGAAMSGIERKDVSEYSSLRTHALQPQMIAHFPERVPEHATQVSLSSFSALSQGANWLQLRMHLPPDEVAALIADLERNPGMRKDPAIPAHGVSDYPLGLMAGESNSKSLPDRFHVYVLNPPLTDEDWNHPDRWGVAIDENADEVLYYAEDG